MLTILYLLINLVLLSFLQQSKSIKFSVYLREDSPSNKNKEHTIFSNDEFKCTLLIAQTIFLNGSETESLECELPDGRIFPILNPPKFIQDKFDNGEIRSNSDLLVSSHADIEIVDDSYIFIGVKADVKIRPKPFSVFGQDDVDDDIGSESAYSLFTGKRTVLVLRVEAIDEEVSTSSEDLSDNFFGTKEDLYNLKSQLKACSFNKLELLPARGKSRIIGGEEIVDGVFNVKLPLDVADRERSFVTNNVLRIAKLSFGCLEQQFDHVAVCLPKGTIYDGTDDWLAYGYYFSYIIAFNDEYCNSMSSQIHELGHNLGLAHSAFDGREYGDTSGLMGYSNIGDDTKIMCFNAVKSWKLGWYRDRHVDLVKSPYNWSGNLYGITDYQRTSSSDMMIVRLGSYFVSFNRRNGITQDVGVGENQVLVHQQNDERARSTLLATLQVGESYSVKISPEKAVVISVDYIEFDSEYASVTIETVLDTDTSEISE